MDDEWEEEEQLVVVELAGTLGNDFLTKIKSSCKILDIDSENPMMQVGQYVFSGEYEDTLGTCVLFEEVPRKGKDSTPELKYMCHTVKKLMMQRVFLSEKKEGESSQGSNDSDEPEKTTILLSDDDAEGAGGSVGGHLEHIQNTVDINMEDSVLDG